METTTAEGSFGMPQTTLVPASILPPDFLDANIDDIVNLIGKFFRVLVVVSLSGIEFVVNPVIADMLDRLTSHNDQIPLRP
jgi:hypothetical protein